MESSPALRELFAVEIIFYKVEQNNINAIAPYTINYAIILLWTLCILRLANVGAALATKHARPVTTAPVVETSGKKNIRPQTFLL